VPAYHRAPVSAELIVEGDPAAALEAAAATGLAREAGPGSLLLAGERAEVLAALTAVLGAALESGADAVRVRVEPSGDAPRFDA
jgi:hypothetical protein